MGQAVDQGKRWFDTVKVGKADAIEALLTSNVDLSTPVGNVANAAVAAELASAFAEAFPDALFQVDRWVESGDVAVAEGTYSGTHTGPLQTPDGAVEATGLSVHMPFATLFRVEGDLIAVLHAYWDQAAFMRQLGLTPPANPVS
jgi:predicted ester cyclase